MPRHYCRNKGCSYSASSIFALSKHKCRFDKNGRKLLASTVTPASENRVHHEYEHDYIDNIEPEICNEGHSIGETGNVDCSSEKREQLLKYCSLLCECSDTRGKEMFKNMHELLVDNKFDVSLLRSTVPTLKSCRSYFKDEFERGVTKDGFNKEAVVYRDGSSAHHATAYIKDAVKCLEKQLSLCTEEDIVLNPDMETHSKSDTTSTFKRHPLETDFFKEKHKKIKMEVMMSRDGNVIWYEKGDKKTFVGFIQVFTDKTVAALKSNSFAAHAVHITLMNFTKKFRRRMIQEGHTVLGFLPVALDESTMEEVKEDGDGTEQNLKYSLLQKIEDEELECNDDKLHTEEVSPGITPLIDSTPQTTQVKGRHVRLEIIYSAMKKMLKPLLRCSDNGFEHLRPNGIKWFCVPHLISYCCDIPEGKDMSAVRHGLSTKRPCPRCIVTTGELRKGVSGVERTFRLISWIRRMNSDNGNALKDHLKEFSIAPWKSFLEDLREEHKFFIPRQIYDIFTFEPLHNLHLGISKLLKTCTFQLLSSSYPANFGQRRNTTTMRSKKIPLLCACNTFLKAVERDSGVSDLHVDFSSKDASSRLNGIFLNTGLRGMLEGKDYRTLDTVFPFVASYVDTITGSKTASLTEVHMQYTEIVRKLEHIDEVTGVNSSIVSVLEKEIGDFKKKLKDLFEPYVDSGLFTLKYHLLDHLCLDLSRFCSLEFLSASPYEYYNTRIKVNYRQTSKRHGTAMDETVTKLSDEIESNYNRGDSGLCTRRENEGEQLVKKGVVLTLTELDEYASKSSVGKRGRLASALDDIIPHCDLPVLVKLIREEVSDILDRTMPYDIMLTVVKSGFIDSLPTPTLDSYCPESNSVLFSQLNSSYCGRKRVFATKVFGASKTAKYSNVFIKGTTGKKGDIIWFAKTLLLFHINCDRLSYHKEMSFVKYYEYVEPKTPSEKMLRCISLRWETEDGVDHSQEKSSNGNVISTGENYGLVPFKSICGVVHIIRTNYAIPPFSKELPWTHHRFCVNRFYK